MFECHIGRQCRTQASPAYRPNLGLTRFQRPWALPAASEGTTQWGSASPRRTRTAQPVRAPDSSYLGQPVAAASVLGPGAAPPAGATL